MARVLGLEEVPQAVKAALGGSLRVSDEAVVLPSSSRSYETGAFKNVVVKISGVDTGLDPEIFSSNWFAGVSAVKIPSLTVESLLRDPVKRDAALKRLVDRIASENADSDLSVGPDLVGDESDRDTSSWRCGFDGSSCCCGIYTASQARAPTMESRGMSRQHDVHFLVCKAGGGVAAQLFHSRLGQALKSGKSLDQALGSGEEPGPQALRRVATAARRNRARILAEAAAVLGLHAIDTVPDGASSAAQPARSVITDLDVSFNSLRRVEGESRSTWLYAAGCTDAALCQGLLTSSNLGEGFIAFTNPTGELKLNLRNAASSCFPFATPRLRTTRELATLAAEQHKQAMAAGGDHRAHPDSAWIRERFGWKSKSKSIGDKAGAVDIEPPALWGSHGSEAFLASWSRELGVAGYQCLRLRPQLVCIAALEPGKLRTAIRFVLKDL